MEYKHDKLNVTDIQGTNTDLYGKLRNIEGRNYMEIGDIDKTKPKQLKQNRITNIPDYKIDARDISQPDAIKFKSKERNPLNPVYKLETRSRRHVIEFGEIDGNAPKLSKSPITRRAINNVSDINGASPQDKGTMPAYKRNETYSSLPPKSRVLATIHEFKDGTIQ